MIGEIGERIAERRQLPVQHRDDARRVARDDQVVEPIVAVHQPRRPGRRDVPRQPVDQPLHLLDLFRFGSAVLLRPALDLARDVVLAFAEIAKPDFAPDRSVCSRAIVAFIAS